MKNYPFFKIFLLLTILEALLFTTSKLLYSNETAEFSLVGSMKHITDSIANNYDIQFFRMSGDGSRAVFFVEQTVRDDRDCFAQQIRIMNTDGTEERVIEQGFTYDTGVGNNCAQNLVELLDISNDGNTVAFVRLNNPEDLQPEIVVHNVATGDERVVLTHLPFRSFGEQSQRVIDPFGRRDSITFKLSGDGNWIYFLNLFGPFGSPGDSGDPEPSGNTLYKVATDGSGAVPILSDRDVSSNPGINPEADSISVSEEIDVNFDGSVVILAISDVRGGAHFFRNLLKITNDTDIKILLNLGDFQYRGGSLSDDGNKLAYAQSNIPSSSGGVYIMNTNEPFNPILIDPGGTFRTRFPNWVRMSGDGTSTTQNMDQGGGSSPSFRWSSLDRVSSIDQPAVRATDVNSQISEDGQLVMFEGTILSEGRFANNQPEELIRFEWGSNELSEAQITSVVGIPSIYLIQFGLTADYTNTYFFNTSGPSTFLFNLPLDHEANELEPIGGFEDFGGVVDDGEFEDVDQQAGDGIYTDGGIWASSGFGRDFALPQGSTLDIVVRSMITSTNRSASFVEFPARILPNPDFGDWEPFFGGEVGNATAVRSGATIELLDNPDRTDIFFQRWDQPFAGAASRLGKIWYIRGFDDLRNGLLTIFYEDEELAEAGLNEGAITLLRSVDGGKTWSTVISEVDPDMNRISTASSISNSALWTLVESSTSIQKWTLY